MIIPYQSFHPKIGTQVFIAPDAWVIGDVEIADQASIFFNSVLRGDIQPIRIGAQTNIQEHSLLHSSRNRSPMILEDQVTVGHRAILHGCRVEAKSLIGMGAIILDDAIIGSECLIGAGSLVTEGKKIPPRSLVMGTPGKVVRSLDDSEIKKLADSAASYVETGRVYLEQLA